MTRAYFQSRLRARLYNLVMSKFRKETEATGLTRAALGRRIGKRPEVITRLLGAPGNWTIETVSDLLMGIAGEELLGESASPFDQLPVNSGYRELLDDVGKQPPQPSSELDKLLGKRPETTTPAGKLLRKEPSPQLGSPLNAKAFDNQLQGLL